VSGIVRRLAGDPDAALRLQGEALARTAEGEVDARERDRMVILKELGVLDVERGAHREAVTRLEEALSLFERRQHRVTPERAEALLALGRARWELAGPADALPHLEAADAFWRGLDPGSRWAGEAALWLGRCQAALGREESRATLARARAALEGSALPRDVRLLGLASGRP
jgi:tetratricopeptide (TPR) repeat protein